MIRLPPTQRTKRILRPSAVAAVRCDQDPDPDGTQSGWDTDPAGLLTDSASCLVDDLDSFP